ncbi:MAG: hypothetical protein WC289_03355 [Patescibacteria group bacterium]
MSHLGIPLEGNIISILPSGYHSDVILLTDTGNGKKEVLKIISKDDFKNEGIAKQLGDDIRLYHSELLKVGIPTSESLTYQLLQRESIWTLIVRMPYHGIDLQQQLKRGDLSATAATLQILRSINPLLKLNRFPIGIDTKAANFTSNGPDDEKACYIDLMPARIRRDGKPVVDWPDTLTGKAYRLAHWRSFTPAGIITVFLSQISRVRIDCRVEIKTALREFLRAEGLTSLIEYLESAPWEGFANKSGQQQRQIVDTLKSHDLYVFREIAQELVSANRMPAEELEKIFQKTHFYEGLMEDAAVIDVQEIFLQYI